MEKKQSVQSVQKAKTIASFVKKNQFFFQFSNKPLSQFLCYELSKCNSDRYTYRIDNVEICFSVENDVDRRQGGYLCCYVLNLDSWYSKNVFDSCEGYVEYNDGEKYYAWREECKVLFQWDKIIECMERCF